MGVHVHREGCRVRLNSTVAFALVEVATCNHIMGWYLSAVYSTAMIDYYSIACPYETTHRPLLNKLCGILKVSGNVLH